MSSADPFETPFGSGALAALFPSALVTPPPDPSTYTLETLAASLRARLVDLPSLDVLDQRLAQAEAHATKLLGHPYHADALRQVERCRRDRAEVVGRERLLRAYRRQGDAYANCWCLGQGGRHEVVLSAGVLGDSIGDGSRGYREFCRCPEGQAAFEKCDAIVTRLEQRYAARVAERAFGQACIPEAYRGVTLDDWREGQTALGASVDHLDTIQLVTDDWWECARGPKEVRGPRVLLLLGDHGNGKTTVACALLQRWLQRGGSGLLFTVQAFFDELRASFSLHGSRGGSSELAVLGALKSTPLLLLDDLGGEGITDKTDAWMIPILTDILSQRGSGMLPTIITTNLSPQHLETRYGPRLAQRIAYSGVATAASFTGLPSLRGQLVSS